MDRDNSEQIADWNGAVGQQWARLQRDLDTMVGPFGDAALVAAAARSGERVIDLGCGCGDTAITLAQAVGPQGAVLGVDVSQPMLEVARARAARLALPQLAFSQADASSAPFANDHDLLFSRFGVMFFGEPVPAFVHLRKALRAGGRCVFVCWRTPRDNPWAMAPLVAARAAMGVTPPPSDPTAPGPFAFADEQRLHGILADAGFCAITTTRFDAPVRLGATVRDAAEGATRIGPVMRFVRDVGPEHLPVILSAIESSLASLAGADGSVQLNGSTWVVSAARQG